VTVQRAAGPMETMRGARKLLPRIVSSAACRSVSINGLTDVTVGARPAIDEKAYEKQRMKPWSLYSEKSWKQVGQAGQGGRTGYN